jgi:hypothetical protein
MNVPADIAKQVVESLRGTPFVLSLLVINIIVLIGFALTLNSISNAMERREAMILKCIDK